MVKKNNRSSVIKTGGIMEELHSRICGEKAIEQVLTIQLEDDDDILKCLKKAMLENEIKEGRIIEVRGFWKKGVMNYFLKNQYKSRKTLGIEKITAGSGKFAKEGNDFIGDLHIVTKIGNQLLNGSLLEGKTARELEIKVKFCRFLEAKTQKTG
ncbi:MAG TPA: DUF296 domain-containing protein [Candidatus Diapherotrites archaeon]|uniref:DUF296 domain-containing protein n=1 Tax=Candidatus Iainarchaeum sp. TaxID=3101447 RepID=A0A7J4KTT4_9ARCH|nr:DUF296 domain-containing protein [Candidatus Diapherotrites archaeon]